MLRLYNHNYVGTQFDDSLFAMTGPFYMLMLLRHIGAKHWVWDKQAGVEFIKPGKAPVYANFDFDQERIDDIVTKTACADVVDVDGTVIARVKRLLYVRRKPVRKTT